MNIYSECDAGVLEDAVAWFYTDTVMTSNDLIVDSCRFKGSRSDEPRRMQILDLYCLARFESEVQAKEKSIKDLLRE